ncbi:trigger factor [Geobacter metallireducens RCH3]|uniref:Trigger factor n=1 Tax=Geobacter metallireducens (strain ATCC 53774 / DSM 7210 / GS-15) TaxID=269799 RepID=TIG_GEOMG|nr:trigger factor [Geobacter metallireducens]Q39UH1.1 RecName: Full=Trigger factor; Short=TF; AltName: Full=PPIase [Geobacter metallireducens GS-15]ABB32103.1 ribosome-associated peptidylprolyl cis-trans isomerase, FKBP-type (trigger factor) [Geobacter metallireducens GS-15]EHP88709.1 trigger factor [Geobacter metallireducens RCH3]
MTSTVESLSSVKKKISFEIPAERVSAEIEKVFGQIQKRAAIKGFRKGKVPRSLVEQNYRSMMESDVLKNLFDETYFKALADHKIFPVSHPHIESDEVKRGEALKYSATVEVFPEIDVKDYKGLEVKRERFVSDVAPVEARLNEMREGMAELKPLEEGKCAETGNFVVIDFVGSVDGIPFEGGAAESYQLELGSGRFIPGFEDQLVGVKAGEQRTVEVTFPEEYGNKDLAGKAASFAVTVKEAKVKELPELDDEFAMQFGEFETLEQLKTKLAELHKDQETARIKADVQDRIVKALIGNNEIEVPSTLVERQLQMMLSNMKNRLAQQRLSLEMMGMDDESFKTHYRDSAESQVKGSLLLEAVAKKEGITVNDPDVEAKLRAMAEEAGQDFDRVKDFYEQNHNAKENLVAHLNEEKVLGYLLENAVVTEVAKDEL